MHRSVFFILSSESISKKNRLHPIRNTDGLNQPIMKTELFALQYQVDRKFTLKLGQLQPIS